MRTRRVAIYAANLPGMPADEQVEALARVCRRRGWGEPTVYRDPPLRPDGDARLSPRLRMLQAALRKQVDVVCVWRLAMLSPSNVNALVVGLAAIRNAGVAIVALGDRVEVAGDGAAARLAAALAEHERATNVRSGIVRPLDPCEGCPMARRRGRGERKAS